jgi:hypothetical protein
VEEQPPEGSAECPLQHGSRRPILNALFAAWAKWQSGERADRRRGKRYRSLATFCQVLAPESLRGDALLMDLSALGACLAVPCRVEGGTLLRLRLSNREQLLGHEVTLRVTHARGPAGAPCRAGGPFAEPLPPRALHALMA